MEFRHEFYRTLDRGESVHALRRAMATPLVDVQKGACLYYRRQIDPGEIDYFVPWSHNPRDLGHNRLLVRAFGQVKNTSE